MGSSSARTSDQYRAGHSFRAWPSSRPTRDGPTLGCHRRFLSSGTLGARRRQRDAAAAGKRTSAHLMPGSHRRLIDYLDASPARSLGRLRRTMLFDTGTPRTGGAGRPAANLAADQAGISTSQLGSRRPGDVQHEQLRRQHLHRPHVGGGPVRAFALAYVTYGFALNAPRGLATDPLLVRFSGTDIPTWRRAVTKCTGSWSSHRR